MCIRSNAVLVINSRLAPIYIKLLLDFVANFANDIVLLCGNQVDLAECVEGYDVEIIELVSYQQYLAAIRYLLKDKRNLWFFKEYRRDFSEIDYDGKIVFHYDFILQLLRTSPSRSYLLRNLHAMNFAKQRRLIESYRNRMQPVKIALVGGESVGKSTLVTALSKHYRTMGVPEFARYYMEDNNHFTLKDAEYIVIGQRALEEMLAPFAYNLLFCDTDTITTRAWCLNVHNKSTEIVDYFSSSFPCDLYIMVGSEVAWKFDGIRAEPKREIFYKQMEELLQSYEQDYFKLVGAPRERVANLISMIDDIMA